MSSDDMGNRILIEAYKQHSQDWRDIFKTFWQVSAFGSASIIALLGLAFHDINNPTLSGIFCLMAAFVALLVAFAMIKLTLFINDSNRKRENVAFYLSDIALHLSDEQYERYLYKKRAAPDKEDRKPFGAGFFEGWSSMHAWIYIFYTIAVALVILSIHMLLGVLRF